MSSISDALKRAQEERERSRADHPSALNSSSDGESPRSLASLVLGKNASSGITSLRSVSTLSPPRPSAIRAQIAETIVEDFASKRDLALPESVVAYHDRSGPIAAQYRKIRDKLMADNPKHEHQILVLTSTLPHEGKTTTLLNLGLSLAEIGTHRVLLIDASLHADSRSKRPTSLTEIMKLSHEPGLSSLLHESQPELSQHLKPTPWTNLFILPSGPVTTPTAAAELFKSAALPAVLRQAKATFTWILVDAPASLRFPDASLLATSADALFLVFALHRTPTDKIQRTARHLKSLNLPLKACIATQAR